MEEFLLTTNEVRVRETLNTVDLEIFFDITTNCSYSCFTKEKFSTHLINQQFKKSYLDNVCKYIEDKKDEIMNILNTKKILTNKNYISRNVKPREMYLKISFGNNDIEDIYNKLNSFEFKFE